MRVIFPSGALEGEGMASEFSSGGVGSKLLYQWSIILKDKITTEHLVHSPIR